MRTPSPSGSTAMTLPVPSTWPCTWWPPSGSPARSAGSTLTRPANAFTRETVSGTTSKESRPGSTATTVRQTPSIATESPSSAVVADSTTSLAPSYEATFPTSRTSPVNTPTDYGSRTYASSRTSSPT